MKPTRHLNVASLLVLIFFLVSVPPSRGLFPLTRGWEEGHRPWQADRRRRESEGFGSSRNSDCQARPRRPRRSFH